jgi:hypothetical protein
MMPVAGCVVRVAMVIEGPEDLVDGGQYVLPTGVLVVAERSPVGLVWFLSAPLERRIYLVDPTGAVRVFFCVDAEGERHRLGGARGEGISTTFTVQDLRPVADG